MLKAVFRVDASIKIGSGHVMRCLTLADALQQQGAECVFISRAHEGHMLETIRKKGYAVRALSPPSNELLQSTNTVCTLSHAHWLGVTWQADVADTQQALREEGRIDWLVVDHYALDVKWEQRMKLSCHRLMVIDDLADRKHLCDLLIDQNLGRAKQDYHLLTQTNTRLLVGPAFALLRSEFAQYRPKSLARRQNPELKHLLVSMGGVDNDNLTGQVLVALRNSVIPLETKITIVMGSHAPWLKMVRKQVASMAYSIEVLVNVENMAELMMRCDIAVGAAGGTAWERCCLGLPTCAFLLADNQRVGARALQEVGAVCLMQECNDIVPFLDTLFQQGAKTILEQMSRAAAGVTDGQGASRVCSYLMGGSYA